MEYDGQRVYVTPEELETLQTDRDFVPFIRCGGREELPEGCAGVILGRQVIVRP